MRSIGTIAHELWYHHGTVYIRIYKKTATCTTLIHHFVSNRVCTWQPLLSTFECKYLIVHNLKAKIDTHGRFIYKKVAAPVRGNKGDYRKLTPSPGITNLSHQLYSVSFCFTIFEVSWFTWVRFHNVLSMANTFAGISMHSQCSTGCYI